MPVSLAVIGLLVACIGAYVIGTPARSLHGENAAANFVDAWRRSQTSSYVVDAAVTRTLPNGQQIQWTQHEARRPPDRLFVGLGTVEGRVNNQIVRCSSAPTGTSQCFQAAPQTSFDDEVTGDVEQLQRELVGTDPLYTVVDFGVTDGAQCFRLELTKQFPSPPYGNSALFCFDVASGANVLTVIEQPEGVTRTVANRPVRTAVTDGDLVVPPDRGAVVGVGGR